MTPVLILDICHVVLTPLNVYQKNGSAMDQSIVQTEETRNAVVRRKLITLCVIYLFQCNVLRNIFKCGVTFV